MMYFQNMEDMLTNKKKLKIIINKYVKIAE